MTSAFSSCYSRTPVARVLAFRDERIESAMGQPPGNPQNLPTGFDHNVGPPPTLSSSQPLRSTYLPPLSRREGDVLRMLAQG